ncbi:MAG: homoserine dehydrogenase [Sphingomonadales bacterium]
MNNPLRVGVAGLGTVGAGVLKVLGSHRDLLAKRCGRRIEVVAVSARRRNLDRGVDLSGVRWHDDAVQLAADGDLDVVVELIGGADGIAKRLADATFASGKAFVTANKALIARHGNELAKAAERAGVALNFEAAVAGGIPVIKALREGLAANRLTRVYGILNGTCNYILTDMERSGRNFDDVLLEAQELGYAEADPSFDIDGIDTAHKLAILAAVAFGTRVNFEAIHTEGVSHLCAEDIEYAEELGYRIKLLGIARLTETGLEQRVHPCMVRADAPIAQVDGVFNAVVAQGDFADQTVFEGRGAGEGPTASAVVADLVDIARGLRAPAFSVPAANLEDMPASPMERHVGAYYVRLKVVDRPGVIADISAVLRDEQVSMEALIQRGRAPDEVVSVVLTVHDCQEAAMQRALKRIAAIETVTETPAMLRIEQF